MKKIIILGVATFVVVGLAVTYANKHHKPNVGNTSSFSSSSSSSASSQKLPFDTSQYKQYAYLISDDTLDAQAEQAIAGFKLHKQTNSDGSQTITLKALEPAYNDQTYTLKPGEKLYFIETSLGDDPSNHELSLSDDAAIIVDAQGYIVKV